MQSCRQPCVQSQGAHIPLCRPQSAGTAQPSQAGHRGRHCTDVMHRLELQAKLVADAKQGKDGATNPHAAR